MIQARSAVALARAGAHVPGQHVKAFGPQGIGHAQHILAAAVALQPVRNNSYAPALPERALRPVLSKRGMLIHIKKVAIGRFQAHPSHRGRHLRLFTKEHGPHGIGVAVAHKPRRNVY